MVTERFIRKDNEVNGRRYFRPRIPEKIQEALGWIGANGALYEWQADTVNGRVVLVRVPTGDAPQ